MAIGFSICSLFIIPQDNMIGFYSGMIVLLVVGVLDDFMLLRARWKFLAQVLASGLLVYFNSTIISSLGNFMSLGTIDLGVFAIPTTIFCIVGMINAINMIDGLDGLAGGVSLIAFIAFAILAYISNQTEIMLLCIALSGTVYGFLIYNWHPSKLFMGDAGSLFLGFSLAFVSIAITQSDNSIVPPVVPLLILAVPIVDTVAMIVKRISEAKNPFVADKNHLHHVFLRFGFSNKNAVKVILLITAIFSCLSIIGVIVRIPRYYFVSAFLIYFVATILHFGFVTYLKKIVRILIRLLRGSKREYVKLKSLVRKFMLVLDIIHIPEKQERYHINLPFSCIIDNNDQYCTCNGTLIDIGIGGFSTKLPVSYTVGEKRKFSLQLPLINGNRESFVATAEVEWMKNGSSNGYRYGFRFIDLDKMQRNLLTNYLNKFPESNLKYDRGYPKQKVQKPIIRHTDISERDATCNNLHGNLQQDSIDIVHTLPSHISGIEEYNAIDGDVLYLPEKAIVYSLNNSATEIWELCDGKHNIVEISQELAPYFNCSQAALLSDVKDFIMKLRMLGLLHMRLVSDTKIKYR